MRRRVSQKQVQSPRQRPRSTRRYHLADDGECQFDSSNPDWLVGAD